METVRIHNKNYDIVLYLDKNKLFGYKFNKDNTIEKIDKNVFKYFDFFTCSNNFTVLEDVDDYKVVLDNETNFKHYFNGGSEDYDMFFINNGIPVVSYLQNDSIKDLIKKVSVSFVVGGISVCLSLSGFNLITVHANSINNLQQTVVNEDEGLNEETEDKIIAQVVSNDLEYEDIKNLINSSVNLNEDEKKLLDNKELINTVLETVNSNNISKYDVLSSFKDIDIKSYSEGLEGVNGYYKPYTSNVIYVKNYDGLTTDAKETITHEYIHLLQYHYLGFGLLKEATAEIISDEFYKEASINAYPKQINLTKKLMEIIGIDPIWNYVFTGDFSQIEENVKPYLNENQYASFLDCLKYDYYNEQINADRLNKLNVLLNILYKNKFNKEVTEDKVITLLDNYDSTLRRYYFNKEYINKQNSFYEDGQTITSVSMTVNEAVLKEYVIVEEEIKEYVSYNKVYDFLKSHDNKGLKRHCTYVNNFKETNATYLNDGIRISGYLGDQYINNVLEEELIERGIIIKSEYFYIKDRKQLTPKEFFDGKYNPKNRLNYISNPNKCYFVSFDSEGIRNVYFSSKTELPTINDRFKESKVR